MMPLAAGLWLVLHAPPQAVTPITIRIAVQSETNLAPQFVETLKVDGRESGLLFQFVDSTGDPDYRVYVLQETSVSGAAAAVLVTDRAGGIVTSTVRSGRLSGRGALNACTKEIAKRLAILRR